MSVTGYASQVGVDDFTLNSKGIGLSYDNKYELSFGRQELKLDTMGGELNQQIIGLKYKVAGELLYTAMPQISVGLQLKKQLDFAIPTAVGARHDSGDPFAWGERMIDHYRKNRVDPRTKTLIFSDSLTIPRTIELFEQFRERCQLAFGVGTNLTNDLGYEPLQIVIKMTRCNGQPVAKLSDTPGKGMCDDEKYLAYLRQVFEISAAA